MPVVLSQVQEGFRALDRLQSRDVDGLQEKTDPRCKVTGLTDAEHEVRILRAMTFEIGAEVEREAFEALRALV